MNPCARLNALSGRTDPLLVSSLSSSDRIRTRTLYMASRQPVAQELRRAMINGVLWLEMVCLPPHAMAGSKYYASQVPPLPSIFSAPSSAPSLSPQGQAPKPIKPALFDTSVDTACSCCRSQPPPPPPFHLRLTPPPPQMDAGAPQAVVTSSTHPWPCCCARASRLPE